MLPHDGAAGNALPDGFAFCPFNHNHVVPSVLVLAHVEECHSCDDLSCAADAMYSHARRRRCKWYRTSGTRTRSESEEPLGTHDSYTSCSSGSLEDHSDSGSSCTFWSDYSGDADQCVSSSHSSHRRRSPMHWTRRRLSSRQRGPRQDAQTQTPPCPSCHGACGEGTGGVLSAYSLRPPAVLGTPLPLASTPVTVSAAVLPEPRSSRGTSAAALANANALDQRSVQFQFPATLPSSFLRTELLRALVAEPILSASLAEDIDDVVVHAGSGFVVCRTASGASELRDRLMGATSLSADDDSRAVGGVLLALTVM